MKSIFELLRYSTVGVLNTISDLTVFSLLFFVFHINVLLANTIAFIFAVSQSYILNRIWTFRENHEGSYSFRHYGKQYLLFFLVNIGGLTISNGTVYLLIEYYPAMIAKLIAAGLVLIWGFVFSKKLVFRRSKADVTCQF